MKRIGNRDITLDFLRGLAIFLILLGHGEWSDGTHNFLSVFDLLLFFFVGGILIGEKSSKYELKEFIAKKFVRIMIPFFLSVLVFTLYALIDPKVGILLTSKNFLNVIFLATSDSFKISGIQIYFWFLPFYFLFSIILFLINKYLHKEIFVVGVLLLAISIRLYILIGQGIYSSTSVFWSIDKLPIVLTIGFIAQVFWQNKDYFKQNSVKVLILSAIILLSNGMQFFDLRKMDFGTYGVLDYIFYGFVGCVFSFALVTILEKINFFKKSLNLCIQEMGKQSMLIYLIHGFVYPFLHSRIIGHISSKTHWGFNILAISMTLLMSFAYLFIEKKVRGLVNKKLNLLQESKYNLQKASLYQAE